MHAVWAFYCHKPCPAFGLSAWIVVFAGIQLFLSQVRSIPTLWNMHRMPRHVHRMGFKQYVAEGSDLSRHCHVQIPNFNSLTVISLLAAVMSISYSTIAIGASIAAGRQPDAYYNMNELSTADQVFGEYLARARYTALDTARDVCRVPAT